MRKFNLFYRKKNWGVPSNLLRCFLQRLGLLFFIPFPSHSHNVSLYRSDKKFILMLSLCCFSSKFKQRRSSRNLRSVIWANVKTQIFMQSSICGIWRKWFLFLAFFQLFIFSDQLQLDEFGLCIFYSIFYVGSLNVVVMFFAFKRRFIVP